MRTERSYNVGQLTDVANRLIAMAGNVPVEAIDNEETAAVMFSYESLGQAVAALLCFINTDPHNLTRELEGELDMNLAHWVGEYLLELTTDTKGVISDIQ